MPKTGKTTLAVQMPRAVLLACEPGYRALPGVLAQDITNWSDMRSAYRDLKKPEVKAMFDSVIVDTIDLAADYCKKYVCNQNDIESLSELGYGKGWDKFKDEFNDVFRGLSQLGYAVVFLGHDKEIINEDGTKTIRPALSASTRTVISGMSDVYGYAHQKYAGEMSVLTLRCSDGSIDCGGRFKYIKEEIPMSYDNLVKAVQEAVDKEAAEHDNKFVTDEKIPVSPLTTHYDFEALMTEFKDLVGALMSKNQSNSLKITEIVEKYLGKGRKVGDCTSTQSEQLFLIVQDLRDLIQ